MKSSFKSLDFFKTGLVYFNERIKNTYDHVKSFSDLGVKRKNYAYSIATGRGSTGALHNGDSKVDEVAEVGRKDIPVRDIERHIIQNAFARNRFYSFRSLKRYFTHIKSLQDFAGSEDYLAGLEITFQGDSAELYNLSHRAKLEALTGLLQRIESEIRQQITEYVGTREFKPGNLDKVFYDKVLKLSEDSERAKGDEGFLADKEWYVFNANYGTSEEKAFVRMLDRQIEKLREEYDGIY